MGKFFLRNSKTIVRMYINQLIMSIFGIMVISASVKSEILIIFSSLLSIAIYMILTYNLLWTDGIKKSVRKDKPQTKDIIKKSFFVILCGSLYNILCALLYTIIKIYTVANNIISNNTEDQFVLFGNILWNIMKLTNSVYTGFESLFFPNPNYGLPKEQAVIDFAPLLTPPYYFFLTLIVIFAVGITAYYLGCNGISVMQKLGFKTKIKVQSEINYKGFGD